MTLNEILADVKHEDDQDPFAALEKPEADQEKTTPSESQTEKEQEKTEPDQGEAPKANTDDEDAAFHKRWEKRAENLKSELEAKHNEEIAKLREEFDQRIPKSEGEVPEAFVKLYGDNAEAWAAYKEFQKQQKEELKQELKSEQEAERKQAEEEVKYWNKWVDDEVGKLQSSGLKFERNELIKVMLDYRPTDETGNFDFRAGYGILEALKAKEVDPARSNARKQIADSTTKSSSGDSKGKSFMTSEELRNKSWNSL